MRWVRGIIRRHDWQVRWQVGFVRCRVKQSSHINFWHKLVYFKEYKSTLGHMDNYPDLVGNWEWT
jgi:hypothetical protein